MTSETGASLRPILEGHLHHLPDSTEFEGNGLCCEWVYWIDFEQRTLEVDDGETTWRWGFDEMRAGMFREDGVLERNIIAGEPEADDEATIEETSDQEEYDDQYR
jgi:hypothetical protein